MKKLLVLTFLMGTIAFVVPQAEAKTVTATVSANPQIRVQIGQQRNRRWNNRRVRRTYTTTRIVGFGRNRFRETIRVIYLPNGRTRTQIISRQRIGRNY